MKVALVYVGIGICGMQENRPLGDREASWIPHGIGLVAASARAAGYEVTIIDMRQLSGWDGFEQTLKAGAFDVFGLSVSPVDRHNALRAIVAIKTICPNSTVIVGGISPTIFPEDYAFDAIDTVVRGEGEKTFVDLLEMIAAGSGLPTVITGEKPDLDSLPIVERSMFKYSMETNVAFAPDHKLPAITMLAGRGCPFQCTYCQPAENSVFGKPYRMRSPECVVAEMIYLKTLYQYQSVTFWDDTFTFRKDWIDRFCDIYEASGIKAKIAACTRADIVCRNEAMVERLAGVGLDWFVIGLESGSQRLLDMIKKGTTVEQNIEAGKICKRHGVKVFGTYMYGLPTETEEDTLATATMIDEIAPEFHSPFWFVPIRGTEIYSMCENMDLILPETNGRTIARTAVYQPTIRDVNYDFIGDVMFRGKRELPLRKAA